MADTAFHGRIKEHMLQNLGDKVTGNRLPDRSADRFFLVTRGALRLVRRGRSWRLEGGSEPLEIAPECLDIARYISKTETFWISSLPDISEHTPEAIQGFLGDLERIEVIFRVVG
jgi:hypothetical protein